MNKQQAIMKALSDQRNAALDQLAIAQADNYETKQALNAANEELARLRVVHGDIEVKST